MGPFPLRGVPHRLDVYEAAAVPLTDWPVIDGHSGEHGDEHAGVTGIVDEVVGRCGHRTCLSDLAVVLIRSPRRV